MAVSRRTKIYGIAALSLLIIPFYFLILPINHQQWWEGFRLLNHFVRAMAPLLTITGFYALYIRDKNYALSLVFLGYISLLYVFDLDAYNVLVFLMGHPLKDLFGTRIGFSSIEMMYIVLAELSVTILTIVFSAETIIKYAPHRFR